MAELSFKVRADYEKVAKLREEIAKLEAQMKNFGRNTSDSEVKTVEAQLAAMTRQYEEMTKKIAEAEAEYDAMAKKMTDKAKDIAAAQDKIVQQASKTAASQNAVLTPVIDQSIAAQAKAYDELKSEIDAIAGSKTNLVNQMLSEQNAIRLINAEIKLLNDIQKENGSLTAAQRERLNQLNGSLLNHKEALSEVRQSLTNYVKLENAATGSMNEISQSLSRMRMVYRDLSESERESPFGKELLASIHQADEKIKELDATIGNHQRNVGNYGSQWNGLNMSIQQLGRELPALAYGPKVFFSAISNNLPILADEIKRARSEYDAMVAAGEKGTPIWKQIGGSILSWQMALTVGITLLTMYGDKIIEWGQKLIQGSKGVISTEKAVKKLNKAMAEGAKEAAAEVVQLKVLEKVATDTARSDDERNKAAKKVLETLHESVNATNVMKVKNGEYATSIDGVTASLIKQAQAQAAMEKIQEQYAKVIDAQSKLAKKEAKDANLWDWLWSDVGKDKESGKEENVEKLKARVEKAQADFNVWLESFVDGFEFDDIFGHTSNADLNNYLADSLAEIEQITKMQADYAKEKAKSAQDMEYAVEQARIDAMKDGYVKTRAQRLLNNKKELEDIERQKQDYIDRIVEQEKAIFDAQEEQRAKNNENYKKRTFNRAESEAKVDTSSYDRLAEQTRQRQAAAEDEYVEGLYKQYQSYQDKKKELEKSYLDDFLALNTEFILTGDEKYKRSIEERRKAYVKAMNQLEEDFGTDEYKLIFGDPERMTSATIDKALEAARKKMSQLDKEADPETFQALSEAIARLEDARDNNPFQGWDTSVMGVAQRLHQIRNIRKDIKQYEEEGNTKAKEASEAELQKAKKDLTKALVGTGVAQFGDALTTAAASMREVAAASGDIHLEQQAEALEKAGGFISSVASGAASGGWVGAIIGGATSLMNMLVSSITESKVVAAEAKKAYEDYLDEIAKSKRQIKDEDYETIFGVRALEKVVDAAEAAKKAREDYQKAMEVSVGNPQSGRGYAKGLENLTLPDGKKLKDEFKDIFEWEENGRGQGQVSGLDLENAKALLKTYRDTEQSSAEWYKGLEKAVAALEDYQNNMKVVDGYLTSLFSNVGSELADAIMQGNDALDVLEQNAGNVFASIAKDMIMGTLMSTEFIEGYKKRLREAMATKDAADDASVLEDFVKEMKGNITVAKEKWDEIKKIAEEYDIDMSGTEAASQQEASSRGYQTLSEDTGNELVGRALAQYESNLRMEEAMRLTKESVDIMAANQVQIRDIAAESRALIADSYLELQQIRENTGAIIKPIKNLSEKIDKWDTKIMGL